MLSNRMVLLWTRYIFAVEAVFYKAGWLLVKRQETRMAGLGKHHRADARGSTLLNQPRLRQRNRYTTISTTTICNYYSISSTQRSLHSLTRNWRANSDGISSSPKLSDRHRASAPIGHVTKSITMMYPPGNPALHETFEVVSREVLLSAYM